ncbi:MULTISPECIES: hypothetical protein [unclassified Mycoplasma]|uniref:hypothetical protein n=1 Tax=unclassified Mycoplasma TaxID=2683645 RepID=UPI00211CF15B|nr:MULTISPECIES: hypothetical protein [unclassified Mycoplasma]UUM19757.1 hypothetical protein NPA11_03235 [Mycoplasma sp. 1578d]UUM24740.1 hypothetical protein NPA12_03525 [Mycoplasma sp. 3686d]
MFKKKLLLQSTLLLSTLSGVGTLAISCGYNGNPGSATTNVNDNKEIIIAVDGAQQTFYNKVIELFNKSESYKEGYRIKPISKSVWDAFVTTVGITDSSVPDIFYAPQDRVTELAVNKSVVELDKFDPKLLDEVAQIIKATPEEKENLKEFGRITGLTQKDGERKLIGKLFGLRHNVEGIILASTKTKDEALKDLNDPNFDSLEELVKAGKAIVRLQDFWYGNGIFGGLFKQLQETKPELKNVDLMGQFLYAKGSSIISGFEENSEYYQYFKQGVDIAARLYFPVYEAAYLLTPKQFKDSVWAKRGMSQEDLKAVLISDVTQLQNKIFELMKNGSIEYAVIVTGDLQVAENAGGAKSFFNISNTVDGVEYRQALGAWNYLVNLRNANASPGRRKAISQVIKTIFEPEANYEYFKADSKVEFTAASQAEIKKKVTENSATTAKKYTDFYKSLGYSSHEDLLKAQSKNLELFNNLKKTPFYEWEINKADNPLDNANLLKPEYFVGSAGKIQSLAQVTNTDLDKFTKTLQDEIALKNALATMFSKKLSEFKFGESQNLIKDNIIKQDVYDKYPQLKEGDGWSLRKIEKHIFGANGDNVSEKSELVNKIISALANNSLENLYKEVEDRALTFVKEVALKPASDDLIKQAVKLYFNEYVNQARWEHFVSLRVKEQEKSLPEGITIEKISTEVNEFLKTLSFDKLLEVLASKTPIKDGGLGQIRFQDNRIDHSNPVLGNDIWTNWNQQTFGNVTFLDSLAHESGNKDLQWFQNKVMNHLSERWKATTSALNNQPGSSTIINFDK